MPGRGKRGSGSEAHTAPPALALALVRAIAVGVAFAAATAATVGLAADETYLDGLAVEAALRGGDPVTLIVVAPGLLLSAALAGRGVGRARPVLNGLLLYVVYAYAYHVFTARFGPLFRVHVAVFVGAGVALALGLRSAGTGHRAPGRRTCGPGGRPMARVRRGGAALVARIGWAASRPRWGTAV